MWSNGVIFCYFFYNSAYLIKFDSVMFRNAASSREHWRSITKKWTSITDWNTTTYWPTSSTGNAANFVRLFVTGLRSSWAIFEGFHDLEGLLRIFWNGIKLLCLNRAHVRIISLLKDFIKEKQNKSRITCGEFELAMKLTVWHWLQTRETRFRRSGEHCASRRWFGGCS